MTDALATLYRLFYDGVLSRLPEPRAIAVGQTALRLLPFDRLPVFCLDDPRLAITLGGVRLLNPLILAAMYYDTRILRRAMGLGFGAVTAKSITTAPAGHRAQPRRTRRRPAGLVTQRLATRAWRPFGRRCTAAASRPADRQRGGRVRGRLRHPDARARPLR